MDPDAILSPADTYAAMISAWSADRRAMARALAQTYIEWARGSGYRAHPKWLMNCVAIERATNKDQTEATT